MVAQDDGVVLHVLADLADGLVLRIGRSAASAFAASSVRSGAGARIGRYQASFGFQQTESPTISRASASRSSSPGPARTASARAGRESRSNALRCPPGDTAASSRVGRRGIRPGTAGSPVSRKPASAVPAPAASPGNPRGKTRSARSCQWSPAAGSGAPPPRARQVLLQPLAADFVGVRQDVLQRAVFLDQREGGLGPDVRDAGTLSVASPESAIASTTCSGACRRARGEFPPSASGLAGVQDGTFGPSSCWRPCRPSR